MTGKQRKEPEMTPIAQQTILEYNITAITIHYILHSLFRGLKPIRRNINEIIFLNGIYLNCKHVSTCMSQDACLKFIGYYNLHKVKYYLCSLQAKGMIKIAEIIHGYNRYSLTQAGISVMDEISEGFNLCLYEFCNKYGVEF